MSLASVATTAKLAFARAGYRECTIETSAPFSSLHAGHGMVWGVSVLPSFEEFRQRWCDSEDEVNAAIPLLIRGSSPKEKWNLTVLVVVCEPLSDDMISVVSEFQENPASFARFVVALDSVESSRQLEDKISFLLLEWMEFSSLGSLALPSIQGEIDGALAEAEAAIGKTALPSLSAAIANREPDPQSIVAAVLSDLKDATLRETQ
jgi:hypothetical protein